jgi:hypothetical protein
MATATRTLSHTVLMQFVSDAGDTVAVTANGSDRTPYSWKCTAGHDGGHPYANLPFCRDDAKAHAAECPGATSTDPLPQPAVEAASRIQSQFPLIEAVAVYETASVRAVQLAALAESGRMSDLDADSLAHAEELMEGARAVLEQAGRLDLIGVA